MNDEKREQKKNNDKLPLKKIESFKGEDKKQMYTKSSIYMIVYDMGINSIHWSKLNVDAYIRSQSTDKTIFKTR